MRLTLRREWMAPGYTPRSLFESPFREMRCEPRFASVLEARNAAPVQGSLADFARLLLGALEVQIAAITGPVHVLLSGGYDSRVIASLCEARGLEPLYITDGMEEPSCSQIMDILKVPPQRRYRHPMDGDDPYGLAGATCDGFAPLYQQLRFMPADPDATLITGLGGGEWFSYVASGWLKGKQRRLEGDDVVAMWMDCWPQYSLLPDAWARGYKDALHPYCSVLYASVAAGCQPEWLRETPGNPPLDLVRAEMLAHLEDGLADPAWMPHIYNWNLSGAQKKEIDDRFFAAWVAERFYRDEFGLPSQMDEAPHACTLAGFATWCDQLEAAGHEVVRA